MAWRRIWRADSWSASGSHSTSWQGSLSSQSAIWKVRRAISTICYFGSQIRSRKKWRKNEKNPKQLELGNFTFCQPSARGAPSPIAPSTLPRLAAPWRFRRHPAEKGKGERHRHAGKKDGRDESGLSVFRRMGEVKVMGHLMQKTALVGVAQGRRQTDQRPVSWFCSYL